MRLSRLWRAAGRLAQHPSVDVGGLLPGVPVERRSAALQALATALLSGGPGYFYAGGVQDLLGDTASIYELSRALHSLPLDVKRRFAGQGGSSTVGAIYSGSDVGQEEPAYDPAEKATARSWDYSRVRFGAGGQASTSEGWRTQAPELQALDFEAKIDALYGRQNLVGAAVLRAMAEVLGEPPSTFEAAFSAGDMGTIRLLYYPGEAELGEAEADVGISAHTDFEAFTLMHQDAPGLQLLPRGAAATGGSGWVDAPMRSESEYIVIIGDVLERYTNGALTATPHRVLRTRHARRSIIRFNAVAEDTVVEPLPAFITAERPRAYTRCTMKQHMQTTLRNLELGLGSWDPVTNTSRSARFVYEE